METIKNKKFTKAEKSWILYDWANSVYATNMMAAIFPIYYAGVAGDAGDKWWGIGVSAASLIVAVLAPFLGAFGDFRGMKKKLLIAFLILGVSFTAVTAFTGSWQLMLVGYVLSHIGFSGANVFYDSFLTDVTTNDRMDRVSSWGYAMGYLGGSTIPFVLSIVLLLLTDFSIPAVKASILLTCVWWAVFSIPLLKNVHQKHYVETPPAQLIGEANRNLWKTMKEIALNRGLLLFIIAYFFYIDGVNTIISLATSYGATLGLGSTGMILALLVTQLVAVPFSILFSRLANRFGSITMIIAAIAVYFVICGVGFFMGHHIEPYQLELTGLVDEVLPEEEIRSYGYSKHDTQQLEQLARDFREAGRDAMAETDWPAAVYAANEEGGASGALGAITEKLTDPQGKYTFQSPEARQTAVQAADRLKAAVLAFAADGGKQDAYHGALAFSTLLFWMMAVLVGMVQGGIQALSRSYFGKLIPPERSNEFFGFFDIFGKFAAVIGPFLYSFFYMLTGRASVGILSLMMLFLIGGCILVAGRRRLREAEAALALKNQSAESQ